MLTSSNFTSGKDFMKKNFRVVKMFLFAAVLVFAFSVNGHAEEAGSQNPRKEQQYKKRQQQSRK